MTNTLQTQAIDMIANADFRAAWPIEVRRILVRAAQTEGEFPAYAVKEVRWALKTAQDVERKCAKDIAQGLSTLPTNDPRRRAALVDA